MTAKEQPPTAKGTDVKPSVAKAWLRALAKTVPIAGRPAHVFAAVIDEAVERYGEPPALLSARECFTYRTLVDRSNRYARWALAQGLAKGDCVGLLMANRPEYVAIWLGLIRIGVVVALLNTNLSGAALARCIDIVAPKHIIV